MAEPDIVVRNIIKNYMSLANERIWIYNQNIKAPTDDDIWCVVGNGKDKIIGSKTVFVPETFEETTYQSLYTTIEIDLASRNRDATTRRYEINMSIVSFLGQAALEAACMKGFRVSEPLDISEVEGAASLNRWRINVIISHLKTKTINVNEYYDKFREVQEEVEA